MDAKKKQILITVTAMVCVALIACAVGVGVSLQPAAPDSGSDTPQPGGSPFPCTLFMVQPSCEAIRRFRAGSFALCGARERCAAPALGQKGRDTYGFPPSLNSYLSLGSLANGPYGPTS